MTVLADAYPDEKVRGKEFEPFLRDALVASPSHQFADVWLWDDWLGRGGSDRGIDLVAEDFDGGLWGIQSKLLGPDESFDYRRLLVQRSHQIFNQSDMKTQFGRQRCG